METAAAEPGLLLMIWNYVLSGFVFFIIFSLIILIHEGGHFWAARFGGIKVEEFGFGLPPKAWGWKNKKSGVLYSINWIPFGGFVKMLGEDDPDNKDAKKSKESFDNRPLWARIFAVSAGVIMNLILAFFIYVIVLMNGGIPFSTVIDADRQESYYAKYMITDDRGVYVNEVVEGSLAEENGIQKGDFITRIEDEVVKTPEEFIDFKDTNSDLQEFTIHILREDPETKKTEDRIISIAMNEEENFGVSLMIHSEQRDLSFGESIVESGKEMWIITIKSVEQLAALPGKIIKERGIPDDVGGPAQIADTIHDMVIIRDFLIILQFAAFISLSIGVLNIMPIPALDGGRLVFLFYEMITRHKPSPKLESIIHGVGFIFLIALIIAITGNDLLRIFS